MLQTNVWSLRCSTYATFRWQVNAIICRVMQKEEGKYIQLTGVSASSTACWLLSRSCFEVSLTCYKNVSLKIRHISNYTFPDIFVLILHCTLWYSKPIQSVLSGVPALWQEGLALWVRPPQGSSALLVAINSIDAAENKQNIIPTEINCSDFNLQILNGVKNCSFNMRAVKYQVTYFLSIEFGHF